MIQISVYSCDGTVKALTLVDDEDGHQAAYHWYLSNAGYARRHTPQRSGRRRTVLLHREILGLVHGDGLEADHVDGNRLNNRRSNLRAVTPAENSQNLASRPGTSRYRGVSWCKRARKWQAQAKANGRIHYLGKFADEHEAGRVASEYRLQIMPFTNEDRRVAA